MANNFLATANRVAAHLGKAPITFETSKILKDQAFINLKVAPIRGVVTWAEIIYEELPEKVKDIY